jgi:hypothetical protein
MLESRMACAAVGFTRNNSPSKFRPNDKKGIAWRLKMKMWKQFAPRVDRWLASMENLPVGFVIYKTAIKKGKRVLLQSGGRHRL